MARSTFRSNLFKKDRRILDFSSSREAPTSGRTPSASHVRSAGEDLIPPPFPEVKFRERVADFVVLRARNRPEDQRVSSRRR